MFQFLVLFFQNLSFLSYFSSCAAIACSMDNSTFAVLAHTKQIGSADATVQSREGAILLFNAEKAVPLSVWFVSKVVFYPILFIVFISVVSALLLLPCNCCHFTHLIFLVSVYYWLMLLCIVV